MWLGPPARNRKMTALALALSGMCGGFGASGLIVDAAPRSRCINAPNAIAPNPQNDSEKKSRRLRAMGKCCGIMPPCPRLIYVKKCIDVEHSQCEPLQRLLL